MSEDGLFFQDPTVPGLTLLDRIAAAAGGAERGGGIFAFASFKGVSNLFGGRQAPVPNRVPFDLVVGIDAITNEATLKELTRLQHGRRGFDAKVLVHERQFLFHPKLCWFEHEDHLKVLVGSGNLTAGGLRTNTEAVSVQTLRADAAEQARDTIAHWLGLWEGRLLDPSDPAALARAKQNSGTERSMVRPMDPEADVEPRSAVADDADVLVIEISKNAGGARIQAELAKMFYEEFFGGRRNARKYVGLRSVDGLGRISEDLTVRQLVYSSVSQNYRLELDNSSRREYPTEGRPIAVFARESDGGFRYQLLWPGDPGQDRLSQFLDARSNAPKNRMRRERGSAAELRAVWPDAPVLT